MNSLCVPFVSYTAFEASATFFPPIKKRGWHEVLVSWIVLNENTKSASYFIHHSTDTKLIYRNQRINGDSWNLNLEESNFVSRN